MLSTSGNEVAVARSWRCRVDSSIPTNWRHLGYIIEEYSNPVKCNRYLWGLCHNLAVLSCTFP